MNFVINLVYPIEIQPNTNVIQVITIANIIHVFTYRPSLLEASQAASIKLMVCTARWGLRSPPLLASGRDVDGTPCCR